MATIIYYFAIFTAYHLCMVFSLGIGEYEVIFETVKKDILEKPSAAESYKLFCEVYKIKSDELFEDPEEKKNRQQWFVRNLNVIKQRNTDFEDGQVRSSASINQFMITTDEEFAFYTGLMDPNATTEEYEQNNDWVPSEDMPDFVDYVKDGYITPVKQQGSCKVSWCFADVAAIESALARVTGKLLSLSEQEILDCMDRTMVEDPCKGSSSALAPNLVAVQRTRLAPRRDYPYVAKAEQGCRSENAVNAFKGIVSYHQLIRTRLGLGQNGNGGFVKKWDRKLAGLLSEFGPVVLSVQIDSSDTEVMKFYGGGIIDLDDTDASYKPSYGHEVLIVGYTPDYFTVKNSWGRDWGIQGYCRFARKKNVLRMYSGTLYSTVLKSVYEDGNDIASIWNNPMWWAANYHFETLKAGGSVLNEVIYEQLRTSRGEGWWREEEKLKYEQEQEERKREKEQDDMIQTESDVDSEVDSEVDSDVDSEVDSDVDRDVDSDVDGEVDSDVDSNADSDVDSEVDNDVDSDVDSDSDVDNDVDNDTLDEPETTDNSNFSLRIAASILIIILCSIAAGVIQYFNFRWILNKSKALFRNWDLDTWMVFVINIVATGALALNIVLVIIGLVHFLASDS